jgi:hypothetical protein
LEDLNFQKIRRFKKSEVPFTKRKMSEQPAISTKSEMNPRTARAVAAIMSQTRTDEMLRLLNQSDGRNQSEQASFLAAESPFLREIYERGGTVVDGVLTVPRENLSASPEIEIATQHAAVERLTVITNDAAKAKELAPHLIEMGERIAGSHADGETRLKIFGWLYRYLEGKQELLPPESAEKNAPNIPIHSETEFAEKWRQIVELSEALAELEPKDRLPENSLEAADENSRETGAAFEPDENMTAEIHEHAVEAESAEREQEFVSGGSLIAFERIEIGTDFPKIPENLPRSDFEKLLEKTGAIDSQLERGVSKREVLAPFKQYVEITRLDNELRLVEEEYAKGQAKIVGDQTGAALNYRFVVKREEVRELAEDRQTLGVLRVQKAKLNEIIQTGFGGSVDRAKVEQSINNQNYAAKSSKIELTEDEAELRRALIKEKSTEREIDALSESINEREKGFRAFTELSAEEIPDERKQQLIEKVASLELDLPAVLKEKYPELTVQERTEKMSNANAFEIRNPAEYLFLREASNDQFQVLRAREIKKEYRKFESVKTVEKANADSARRADEVHREKIQALKTIEPLFAYKIEGSNRIIKAEPSERAAAGYKFAAEYVRYQLKQPEIRARHESAVYREYAARLEASKIAQDVVRESYKIRQENHRAAGVWKNANSAERQKLARPLSKNEMTLLFLEQPPKNYTAEMSVLKYNFAHYSQAKEKMTDALEAGNLEPSSEALQLAKSLEGRLNRRELETKRKATKHFFESLKTENEKLHLKNEFDHRAIYQNLPPHEKDWIYRRATSQRENIEYKIAYEQERNHDAPVQPQNVAVKTSDAAASLRQEFAAGTLWHQAATLTNQKETKNLISIANFDAKTLQAVGFLIHNQSETNNLRVGEWLANQESEEMKSAGEILKTFAGATREIKNNRLTVTVKIAETNRVSAADYQNLFERYFPADFEKLKEFRADKGEKFRLEQSRRDGQNALLDDWKHDAQTAIYSDRAPVTVFENERRAIQEIEKTKAAQIECRRAVEIKNAILTKYEEKLKREFAKSNRTISDGDLRTAVERAFTPEKSETLLPEQKMIFERAQDKILSSDFERFSTSAKSLEKGIDDINQSFETIAELRLENEQYKLAPEKAEKIESLQNQYDVTRHQAEAEQITAVSREKFSAATIDENDKATALVVDYVSVEEREKARTESHRQARIALETAELNEPDQNSELQAKALEFADALETAHQASLHKKSKSEIAKAFITAETKRERLNESLKIEKESSLSIKNKPVTLLIYELELARNERAIAQAKIAQKIETGKLSLADLETKKAGEIFSAKERDEIRVEAGERTRENLEPKELWARHGDVSEKLQQAALGASDALERAHEIYHEAGVEKKEIAQAFSALDVGIVQLKNERRTTRAAAKFYNFKTDFKRDLAQMFERGQPSENPQLLAAMTKGLLITALEKQNVPPEKIGVSSEKLSEISRTITLAMVDDKKRDKTISVNNQSALALPVSDNRAAQAQTIAEKSPVPIKMRQFEHNR